MWHTFKMCLFAHSVTRGFLTGYILSMKKILGALFSLIVHFPFPHIQVYSIFQLNFNYFCRGNSRKNCGTSYHYSYVMILYILYLLNVTMWGRLFCSLQMLTLQLSEFNIGDELANNNKHLWHVYWTDLLFDCLCNIDHSLNHSSIKQKQTHRHTRLFINASSLQPWYFLQYF